MEKAEKEGKQKLSFRFVLSRRVIQNSKILKKKFKKLEKYSYGFFSRKNWLEKAGKERK